jgi:hypothetical protein
MPLVHLILKLWYQSPCPHWAFYHFTPNIFPSHQLKNKNKIYNHNIPLWYSNSMMIDNSVQVLVHLENPPCKVLIFHLSIISQRFLHYFTMNQLLWLWLHALYYQPYFCICEPYFELKFTLPKAPLPSSSSIM